MSELGNLTVRLALDNASFQEKLQQSNRDIKLAGSEFKNATAGTEVFGKGLNNLEAKSKMLSKQFEAQSNIVQLNREKHQDSKKTLDENIKAQEELKTRLDASKKAYEETKNILGENAEETKILEQNYKDLSEEYTVNEEKLRNNVRTMENWENKVNNAEAHQKNLENQLKNTTDEIEKQSTKAHQLGEKLELAGNKMIQSGDKIAGIGKGMTAGITTPLVALGGLSTKVAIEFESAFAGVKKTIDGTPEQLKKIEQGIIDMSMNVPSSTTEIAALAEAAGQLGIETDNVLSFSKVMTDLANSTNIVGEEGASQLAKFANITQMSQDDFDRLGSTIVDLGNNLATTEKDIVNMGMRLAGAGAQIGMSEAQIMAMAGALSSVGIEAEAGGSAFSKVMINMQLAAETGLDGYKTFEEQVNKVGFSMAGAQAAISQGGKQFERLANSLGIGKKELKATYKEIVKAKGGLDDFANVAGMSGEEFTKLFKEDSSKAIIKFIEGLGKAEEQGMSTIAVLENMDIKEVRLRDSLLRAANASEVFSDALELGNKAWEENTALLDEASQRYETTESQLQMNKNRMLESARVIGQNLLPVVADISGKIADITGQFAKLNPETQQSIIKMAGLAAGIGPVIWGAGKLTKGFGNASLTLGKFLKSSNDTTAGVDTLAKGFNAAEVGVSLAGKAMGLLPLAGVAAGLYAGGRIVKSFSDEMSEAAFTTEEFGEEISEGTRKAVQGFSDLNINATKELTNLKFSNENISKEVAEDLDNIFMNMSKIVTDEIVKNKDEAILALNELLEKTSGLSEEEKVGIINDTQEAYEKKRQTIEEADLRISEILLNAADENRQLRAEEIAEIEQHQILIRNTAVKEMSQSEVEQKAILENMRHNANVTTAEQALEVAINADEQKEKVIAEAKEQYEGSIAEIIRLRDESGSISDEQADKLIQSAERQKRETVKKAEEMHTETIGKVKELSGDLEDEIDWLNRKKKTGWDKAIEEGKKSWGDFFKNAGSNLRKNLGLQEKAGEDINKSLAKGIEGSQFVPISAVDETGEAVILKIKDKKDKVELSGGELINAYSVGMDNERPTALKTAGLVGDDTVKGLDNAKAGARTAGMDLVEGFAIGMSLTDAHKVAGIRVGNEALKSIKTTIDSHSPSREAMKLGITLPQGLQVGMEHGIPDVTKSAEKLAKETLKALETEFSNQSTFTVPVQVIKNQTSGALNKGNYDTYTKFTDNLKADELEEAKKLLEKEYKLKENALKKEIRGIDKKKHKKTIENNKVQQDLLRERNQIVKEILDERLDIVNEKMTKETNIFTDKMTQYNESIKRLSFDTDDLTQKLTNQNAIYILQTQRIKELETQHKRMSKEFGDSSKEAINLKKSLEQARTEVVKYGNDIESTMQKIRQNQIDLVNDTKNRIMNALRKRYQEEQKLSEDNLKIEIDNLNRWKDENLKAINDVYDEKIKRIRESTAEQVKALEDEIKALDEAEKSKSREDIDKEELGEIDRLKESLVYEHDEYNKLEIKKQIEEKTKEREERLRKQDLEDKKEALRQEIEDLKEAESIKIDELEKSRQYEIERINEIHQLETESLNQRLAETREHYARLLEESALHKEAEKLMMEEHQNEIIELLHSYEEAYNQAGQSLGEKFVAGFEEKVKEIESIMDRLNSQFNDARDRELSSYGGGGSNNSNNDNRTMSVNINSPRALDHREVVRQTNNALARFLLT